MLSQADAQFLTLRDHKHSESTVIYGGETDTDTSNYYLELKQMPFTYIEDQNHCCASVDRVFYIFHFC